MSFYPTKSRVLVSPISHEKSEGGIYFPENHVNAHDTGTIFAVGPDSDFNLGDTVMFSQYTGKPIVEGGKEFLLVDEVCILGVIKE